MSSMYGWTFRSGDTSATIAEPNKKVAEVVATHHLGGEPDKEPARASEEVFNIYSIKRGGVLIARMRNKGLR